MDQKLDTILQHLKDLNTKIDNVEANLIARLNENIKEIKTEVNALKESNDELKQTIAQQQIKIKSLELSSKANNIVLFGISPQVLSENINQDIINLLSQYVEINISNINYTRKLGRGNGPILLSLTSWNKKKEILTKKQDIKDDTGITIKADLPYETRKIRKELSYYWNLKEEEGKKVHIRHEKLIIDGKSWTLEDLKNEEKQKIGKNKEVNHINENMINNSSEEEFSEEPDGLIHDETTISRSKQLPVTSINHKTRSFKKPKSSSSRTGPNLRTRKIDTYLKHNHPDTDK